MSDLNSKPLSWQDINEKLSSESSKKAQLKFGTVIFILSCLILTIIAMFNADDWEERFDVIVGGGGTNGEAIIFFMAGYFLSLPLLGWPFWKLRQIIIQPLLVCESEYEWFEINKRLSLLYKATFLIQIIIGILVTIYAYYFFST